MKLQEDVKWNSLVKPFVRIELTIFRLLSERFTTKLKRRCEIRESNTGFLGHNEMY